MRARGRGRDRRRAAGASCEVVGVFVNADARRGRRRRPRTRQLDAAPAARRRGARRSAREVARRTGCKVIKALRVRERAPTSAPPRPSAPTSTCSTPTGPGRRGGTGESFDWELLARAPLRGAADPRRRADARERRRGDRGRAALRGRRRQRRRGRAGAQGPRRRSRRSSRRSRRGAAPSAASRVSAAAVEERFGPYGGRYVPETLIAGARRARARPGPRRARTPASAASSTRLLRDYVGRPTPLYLRRAALRAGRRAAST